MYIIKNTNKSLLYFVILKLFTKNQTLLLLLLSLLRLILLLLLLLLSLLSLLLFLVLLKNIAIYKMSFVG